MNLFFSKLVRTMLSIDVAPAGDGSRTVCVWTWEGDDGYPTQHQPFAVASLDEARGLVPDGAECSLDAPDWFAEEVWTWGGDEAAVPAAVPAFETEPTLVLAAHEQIRVRS